MSQEFSCVNMLMPPNKSHSRFCAFRISTKFKSLWFLNVRQIEKEFVLNYSSKTLPPTMGFHLLQGRMSQCMFVQSMDRVIAMMKIECQCAHKVLRQPRFFSCHCGSTQILFIPNIQITTKLSCQNKFVLFVVFSKVTRK